MARRRSSLRSMSNAERWEIVEARGEAPFFFGVKTTGVYCRPGCPSRMPKRENVTFYATREEARAAGFRACMRCEPDAPPRSERDAACIARACRTIEGAETPPSLSALADEAGLSLHHFHRLFRKITGVTPKAYADAQRAERVREDLPRSLSVTRTMYDAGYNASSRFYATSSEHLGMTPSRYRAGGKGTAIRYAIGKTPLGRALVAMTERGVCAIFLGDDEEQLVRDLEERFPRASIHKGDRAFTKDVARVLASLEAPAPDLPLDIQGTAFQRRVWEELRKIPAGETRSYADVARALGKPSAVRAVARACGANPVAVAIPCHRVVRNDGQLSGYRWGVERKRALLARERSSKAH